MSIEATLARVSAIRQALIDPATMIDARTSLSGGTEAPAEGAGSAATAGSEKSFASALQQASSSYASPSAPTTALGYPSGVDSLSGVAGAGQPSLDGSVGGEIVAIAESQLGQTEQPPGSNESSAI